ncbi:MATE efflux family protein [Pseudoflavonifractor capillosus ATCC 29799]|uniref:Probable multidrug resistance protein NorM n=1 Tax=Pseudoflavonifractor capillosus ATCC 29799 TaxID=411467 RepID=A6NZD9_9FIRM|nr:MATE efflux family protein [Pseudoflavonifractor capillosus ATCC 29799]
MYRKEKGVEMEEQTQVKCAEREQPTQNKPLFSRQMLIRLIIPLVIEQFLLMSVGMADTVMVTTAGEAAVSGVSLVDNINTLMLQIFAALSTGGAVVVSQYLGRKESHHAKTAAKQLLYAVTALSSVIMILCLIFREHLLFLIFGSINDDVMESAVVYFISTALAYPFMALYNAGAALFRSMGNSKVSMFNSLIVNIVNIAVNAILIFGFGMGSLGAGIGTLTSRIVAAVIILFLLQHRDCVLRIEHMFRPEFHWVMVRRILTIGIPTGLENGLFQVGKLVVLSLITSFDAGVNLAVVGSAVAANAIANSVAGVINVPGQAIGLAMVTVVGQCVGAQQLDQAVRYTRKLMILTYLSMGTMAVILFFGAGWLVTLFNLSAPAAAMAAQVLRWNSVFVLLFWPMSFTLPNALRAAGDAMFTMSVSLISMFTCRIVLSYVLGADAVFGIPMMGLHLLGVWIAMFCDWIVRATLFLIRFWRGKWKQIQLI